MLKLPDDIERVNEIGSGAFFRVGEVEEESAPGSDRGRRENAFNQIGEDRGHVGNHGPVDQGNEIARGECGAVAVDAAEGGRDVGGGDFVEAAHHAEHDFAVREFDGGGLGRFDKRDDAGAAGEVGEDRMHGAAAECADVGDAGAVGEQGVAHDRAVATEFVHARIELDVGALAGGAEDALAEFGNRGKRREVVPLAGALGDWGHDGIHETIETNQRGLLGKRATAVAEFTEGASLEVHGKVSEGREKSAGRGGKQIRAGRNSPAKARCEKARGISVERAAQTRQLFNSLHHACAAHCSTVPRLRQHHRDLRTNRNGR